MPTNHPLRKIRELVRDVLGELNRSLGRLYASEGRPSQNGEVFTKFMTKLLNHPQVKPLLSDEHFSVDGTLIEAWASHKSFRPKDGSGDEDGGANFHGQQRKNDTHAPPM